MKALVKVIKATYVAVVVTATVGTIGLYVGLMVMMFDRAF